VIRRWPHHNSGQSGSHANMMPMPLAAAGSSSGGGQSMDDDEEVGRHPGLQLFLRMDGSAALHLQRGWHHVAG
jgi:hypothetical protein